MLYQNYYGRTGVGDLTNNKYAAMMRELAEGLSGWAGLLLPFLYLYQIFAHEQARFFSLKTFGLILGGEIIFVLITKLSNALLAAINALVLLPVMSKGKVELAQNITNTTLALFGLLVLIFAWFFASYTSDYMYQ